MNTANQRVRWQRGVHVLIVTLATGTAMAMAWLWRFNDPFVSDDHLFYLLPGWQMLYGELPVRDFFEYGAPLYHAIAAAVQVFGGRGILSEVVFSVTVLAVCAGGIVVLGYRASGSLVLALAGTGFYILSSPRLYSYPKSLFAVVTIPALWMFIDRPGWRRVTIIAAITALGFLWRHDHGVYIALTFLVWLLCLVGLSLQRRLQYALLYIGLVFVFVLPFLVYVGVNGGVFSYFQTAVDWARRDVGRTPLAWPSLVEATDWPAVAQMRGFLPRAAAVIQDNWVAWLFYAELLVPLVAVVLLAASHSAFRPAWPHATARIGALAVLGLVFNAGFLLRSPVEARLGDPAVPHAILIPWMIAALAARPKDLRPWLRRPLVAFAVPVISTIMIVVLLTITALASSHDIARHVEKIGLDRGLDEALQQTERLWHGMAHAIPATLETPPAPDSLVTLTVFVRECTRPSDRVFLTNYLPQVLGFAERAFAAGLPPSANQGAGPELQQLAVQRLQQQSVPIAFVGGGPSWGNFREDLPILTAYFDEHYVSVAEQVFEQRFGLRLLLRRDVTVARTFEPLGWPCVR